MGQRTAILVKKHFDDGTSTVNMYHRQWGFGKEMPALLMQDLLHTAYNSDVRFEDSFYHIGLRSACLTFKGLADFPYITDGKNVIDEEDKTNYNNFDVFDKKQATELFDMTDNNNGGMIIEVWEKPTNCGYEFKKIQIAFVKGWEDCEGKDKAYAKLMTAREYMSQWKDFCDDNFLDCFDSFLKFEEVTEKKRWNSKHDGSEGHFE